jgi:RNA polymerase sigma-70 factor (ECF subfamily)
MNREEIFKEAVSQNRERILRICSYYFSDPDQRADAFQDALIRLWENLPGFRGEAQISTWIYRVVVNVCLTTIRKEVKRNALITPISNVDQESRQLAEEESPSTEMLDVKLKFFRHFISGLSASDRILVSLYLEDLSTREMAEITGISEPNVRVRIHRIKEKIKHQWEENNHGTR